MNVKEAGQRGGIARAKKLSRKRRIEIARQGYKAAGLGKKNGQKIPKNSSCA